MGIGSNIKKMLAEKKMKITELSEKSGVKINTLYSITKRDSVNVNSDVLTAIATALDVSPFDLTLDSDKLQSDVKVIEEIKIAFGSDAVCLLQDFDDLNVFGKAKACEYISDLAEQPKYTKKEPASAATEDDSKVENQ